jgi:ribose transport system permease protein
MMTTKGLWSRRLRTSEPAASEKAPKHRIYAILSKYALFAAWACMILIFALLEPHTFLTRQNITSTLSSQAVLVLLTYALVVTLTTGEYDLSVAAVLTLSSMIIAILNTEAHISIVLSVLAAVAIGLLVGVINGVVIVAIGVDSIIATLGMGSFLSGIVLWISGGNTLTGISNSLVTLVVVPHVFGLSLSFIYVVIATILLWYVLSYVPVGRRLLYVGRSREVSRLSGLRVGRLRWGALIAASFIAALAGVLYAGTTGGADPTSGLAFLLPAFAGAFLGSTTIQPGRFNAWGSFAAVYFLVTGIDGLSLLGIQVFVQDLFYGAALIVAVSVSVLARRRANAT